MVYLLLIVAGASTAFLWVVLVEGSIEIIHNVGGLTNEVGYTMLGLVVMPVATFAGTFAVVQRRYQAISCALLYSTAATLPVTMFALICAAWLSIQW